MGVAVDETGCDPASRAIHDLCRVETGRGVARGTCEDDGSVARGDEAVVDFAEPRAICRQRREARVAPDSVTVHSRSFYMRLRDGCGGGLDGEPHNVYTYLTSGGHVQWKARIRQSRTVP